MDNKQHLRLQLESLEPRVLLSVSVAMQAGSDTGLVGDGITSNTRPVYDITVNAPGTINVDWDGDAVNDVSTFVNGAGTYAFMPGSALAEGAYPVNVTFGAESASAATTIDATPPTISDTFIAVVISVDGGAAGVAGVGDTITVTWDNSAAGDNNADVDAGAVTANLSAFGGSATAVMTDSGGGIFSVSYVIAAGTVDGTAVNASVTARDTAANSATTADTSNVVVDNKPPVVTNARIAAVISTDAAVTGVANIGDTITVTWDNSAAGDNNDDIATVVADMVAFGQPDLVTLVDDGTGKDADAGDGIFTGFFTIVAGNVDATNRNASVTVTDGSGASTTTADTSNLSVDSIAPVVQDATIAVTISTDSRTTGVAEPGDVIKVTFTSGEVSEMSAVTVDLSAFGGSATATMYDNGTNGDTTSGDGIWSLKYTILLGSLDNATANAAVTAKDNAGNQASAADTSGVVVDNGAVATFTQGTTTVAIYDVSGDIDVSADNIEVIFNKDDSVHCIRLRGAQAMTGLGILVTGSTYVDGIRDLRTGDHGDVAFIAADGHIRTTELRSGLTGYNLNGLTLFGLTFEDDIDDDGSTTDLTGFYSVVSAHNVWTRGDVDGDVWLGGEGAEGRTLDHWRTRLGDFNGGMTILGDAGLLKVKGGDFGGILNVSGDMDKFKIKPLDGEGGTFLAGAQVTVEERLRRAFILVYETDNSGDSFGLTVGSLGRIRGFGETLHGNDLPFTDDDFEIVIG